VNEQFSHESSTTFVPIKRGMDSVPRLSMILWGLANVGKTTLAATAPGEKLWLSFGDNEHASVAHSDDVHVMDYSRCHLKTFLGMGVGQSHLG
jgi:hypothetical protein